LCADIGEAKGKKVTGWCMNAEKLMVQCFSFIEVMTNLARSGGPPWDAIAGAELVKHYKPDKEVYRSAPYFFGLKPEEVWGTSG
jgi:hypothetical protein